MYKYVKTGVGPFKRLKLCETFGRNDKPMIVKDIEELLPQSVTLTHTGDGLMQLTTPKGCTNVDIYAFDIVDGCITYLDADGNWGFITRQGKVIPTNNQENATMSTLEVFDNVVVAKIVHNKSRIKEYLPFDATTGKVLTAQSFKEFHCGDKEVGLKSKVIFFKQDNGNKTLISRGGEVLATDCIRYDNIRNNLITLSLDKTSGTLLKGYNLEDGNIVRSVLTKSGIVNFDFDCDELITYTDKKSSVYTVDFNNHQEVFRHKFDAEGRVKRISYTFYGECVYTSKTKDVLNILNDAGQAVELQGHKNLVDAKFADEGLIVTTVKNGDKEKQGLIDSYSLKTIINPEFDKVTTIGCDMVVNTIGDTFELVKLVQKDYKPFGSTAYEQNSKTLIEMNNYFRPQKTDRKGTILCEDSNGEEIIIAPQKSSVAVMPIDKYDEYLDNRRNAPLAEIFGEAEPEQEQTK